LKNQSLQHFVLTSFRVLLESASKVDEESEMIYQQLLSGEITLADFLQNYRKLRFLYHKRTLTRLAAKTSL
jgi:ESCRT-I complex subunit VPS37